MGYRSGADEALDRADTRIREAIDELSEVVLEKTDGSADYTTEYRDKVFEVFTELVRLRRMLDR